ncbi:hypothetical protein C8J57DRAFT_1073921 [Mycena rebaudengoi]|nr:hypothetical protein C8J57DRAFT_1086582 [Mycena rebaudengoi]KAJ7258030.1 hypothetical protein C8J57DRAFT_1073921 [Mycena rebaudengoi]
MSTRAGGRQAISELSLPRVLEPNQWLGEVVAHPCIHVSEPSASLIWCCKTTKDYLTCR